MGNYSLNNRIITVISSVLVILLVGVLLFVGRDLLINDDQVDDNQYLIKMTEESELADSFLNAGNPEAAIEVFDRMISTSINPASRYNAAIRKASALFATGDLGNSYSAINILGELLSDQTVQPIFRGWAMAELLQSYYMSQNSELLNRIRSLFVFADLQAVDDAEFLSRVAEMSDDLYPSVFGKILLAVPVARNLEYAETKDKNELSNMAKKIQLLVNESTYLQQQETWFNDPYSRMLVTHYRGLMLGTAVKGGLDPVLATEQFEHALAIAEKNKNILAVQKLSTYTHLYYAFHLSKQNSDSNLDQAIDEQLAQVIQKAPSTEYFVYFVRAAHSNPDTNNYQLLADLTAHNSDFKDFIESNYSVVFSN